MSKATPSGDAGPTPSHRLESWKEIAVYLKRAVRTVRRWEKDEGLPVHRHLHKKLGTIYAHKDELDAWWKGRTGPSPPGTGSAPGHLEPSRLMVAILPFESLSADAGQDYFGEGLTQEVIVELGRTAPTRLGVIARTTSMHYKGARRTVRQIGAELGVDFVLEGSVRREAECVRVTAQLIQAKDQSHVWAGSYDQAIGSMLALQREIATDIARSISVSIPQPPVAPARPVTAIRPASYDAYIKGRHFLNDLTSESVQTGIECLRRSIALDPNNAPAHAALAEACAQWPLWADVPSVEMLGPAIEAAHIALGLDPNLADAHASLGLIHAYYVWDWSKAERDFERALELNPGCSQAGQWYSEFLAEMGRTDQALAIIDQAMRHDPLSLGLRSSRAFALWLGRRYDEAIAEARRVLEVDPAHASARIRLGVAYTGKGMYEEGVHAFRLAKQATPGLLACTSLLGYACARAGRPGDARAQIEELRNQAKRRYVPPFLFATIYVGLGEHEEALALIEDEFQRRGWYLLLIRQSPVYDPLRTDRRFLALLNRMNLPG